MREPLRGLWKATGRYRVRRYWTEHGGPVGTPAWRWGVIGPAGEHIGSAPSGHWPEAIAAADALARDPRLRWG